MMRVMLDTDQPWQLTNTGIRAGLLATYADLITQTKLAVLEKDWPRVVLIDRGLGDPLGKASVIDIERGTHGPADAPGWYDRQKRAGIRYLTVYCNRATLPAVNAAMGHRAYFRWIATLDGTAHIGGFTPGLGPAAVQTLGAAALGFHADLSLVLEPHWHPAPHPTPPPAAAWISQALADANQLAALLKAHST
jgi:hypothetical protein